MITQRWDDFVRSLRFVVPVDNVISVVAALMIFESVETFIYVLHVFLVWVAV
jgi:hypothetical protein